MVELWLGLVAGGLTEKLGVFLDRDREGHQTSF